MEQFKDDPLKFINTFLRKGHEPMVTEEDYKKVSKGKPDVYNLGWQVRVRKKFFND